MRIIQISDTHLSASHDFFAANNHVVAEWLKNQQADIIIHTGDLCMDGSGARADFETAQLWKQQFKSEMLLVPGNHDVGDLAEIAPAQPLNDARLAQWRDRIGPDWWQVDRADWRLIGLNAMLFGTRHPQEEAQFLWLEQACNTNLPIALFMHKPIFIDTPDEGPRGYWTVLPEPRARLLGLMANANVKLVCSGHLHIQREKHHAGISHIWGPSTSFIVGEMQEDLGGKRTLGVVEHVFSADQVISCFIRPEGLDDQPLDPVHDLIYPSFRKSETVE